MSSFDDEIIEQKEYPYELLIVDADTPVFRASKFVQEDYVIVTHIPTGKEKEFKTKTEFYGHWQKKNGGWLRDTNLCREEKGLEPFPLEDFEVEQYERLLPDIVDHVEEGIKSFDFFVGSIKKTGLAPDYKLLIGGEGNFRYDIAETWEYKANRAAKPLLFEEIREAIISKYKSKVEIVNTKECDDQAAYYGRENVIHFQKTGKWKYCLGILDKDLRMIYSPQINYDHLDEGVYIPTPLECAKYYGKQLLCGDKSVDNIPGLPDIPNDLREKYQVRKGKSVGDSTAINYLKSCETIQGVFSRLVEAYRAYYGEEPFEFENYKGEKYQSTWLDRLNEQAMLVFMNYYENPLDYDIRKTLDKVGVSYE